MSFYRIRFVKAGQTCQNYPTELRHDIFFKDLPAKEKLLNVLNEDKNNCHPDAEKRFDKFVKAINFMNWDKFVSQYVKSKNIGTPLDGIGFNVYIQITRLEFRDEQ